MWRYGRGRTIALVEQAKKDELKRREEVKYFQVLLQSNKNISSPSPALTEQELEERSETSTHPQGERFRGASLGNNEEIFIFTVGIRVLEEICYVCDV